MADVWDIGIIAPIAHERVGYPTQKPEALLRRVIEAASRPGDLVVDLFAGSGTTLAVGARVLPTLSAAVPAADPEFLIVRET